jgi:hypothetical protein
VLGLGITVSRLFGELPADMLLASYTPGGACYAAAAAAAADAGAAPQGGAGRSGNDADSDASSGTLDSGSGSGGSTDAWGHSTSTRSCSGASEAAGPAPGAARGRGGGGVLRAAFEAAYADAIVSGRFARHVLPALVPQDAGLLDLLQRMCCGVQERFSMAQVLGHPAMTREWCWCCLAALAALAAADTRAHARVRYPCTKHHRCIPCTPACTPNQHAGIAAAMDARMAAEVPLWDEECAAGLVVAFKAMAAGAHAGAAAPDRVCVCACVCVCVCVCVDACCAAGA